MLTCKEYNSNILNIKDTSIHSLHVYNSWFYHPIRGSLPFTWTFSVDFEAMFKLNFLKPTLISFGYDYLCISSHGCFPVKSPNDFIAEAPSNPLLILHFKISHTHLLPWFEIIQWNLVIKRSDITKPSYNKVILLVPVLYISLFF